MNLKFWMGKHKKTAVKTLFSLWSFYGKSKKERILK